MYDKTSLKIHHFVFENQSIYIGCHKSFCINLGEGTLFFTQIILVNDYILMSLRRILTKNDIQTRSRTSAYGKWDGIQWFLFYLY